MTMLKCNKIGFYLFVLSMYGKFCLNNWIEFYF